MEIDNVSYLKFFSALLFVLGLIGGIALLAKKLGMGNRGPMRRDKNSRLSIIETMQLDAKRRIILIRRDDKEYMLLIGGVTELVVDGNLKIEFQQKEAAQPPPDTRSFLEKLRYSNLVDKT
jgi:flagellar protein FliO/FliZ